METGLAKAGWRLWVLWASACALAWGLTALLPYAGPVTTKALPATFMACLVILAGLQGLILRGILPEVGKTVPVSPTFRRWSYVLLKVVPEDRRVNRWALPTLLGGVVAVGVLLATDLPAKALDTVAETFSGHTKMIRAVAFSPDGSKVLTGSDDGNAKVWDTTTGEELRTFVGHKSPVNSVACSFDGTKVLTGSYDSTAKLWDALNGEMLRTLRGHREQVYSVAFSPDGTQALTGSGDGTAKLWGAHTGKMLRTFAHVSIVNTVAFSPDGAAVLAGASCAEGTARMWNVATGRELQTFGGLAGMTGGIHSVAFSPDGSRVLAGHSLSFATLWDTATGEIVGEFFHPLGMSLSVAFSPDGTQALTRSRNGSVRLWDVATGKELKAFSGPKTLSTNWGNPSDVCPVAFSPDGSKILTSGENGVAVLRAIWPRPFAWIWAVVGGLLGTVIGVCQWFELRRHVAKAGWWVLANLGGWAIGATVAAGVLLLFQSRGYTGPVGEVWATLQSMGTGGGITGVITGGVLIWLLPTPVPERDY